MTKHWFTCRVKSVRHDSDGAEIKVTEAYVLDGYSYTEAEYRMATICEEEGIRPFEIVSITKSPIHEVIRFDDADNWFRVVVALTTFDEQKGVEKETNQNILLSAADVRDAFDKVAGHMRNLGIGYVIPSIAFQKITAVYPLDETEGGRPATPVSEALAAHIDEETGEVF